MKLNNFILLVTLLVFTKSLAVEFTNLVEVAEFKQDPFGRSLLETINIEMQKGGNVDKVKGLLKEVLKKLQDEQLAADKAWFKENKRLLDKIENLKQEIKTLKEEIVLLKKERIEVEQKRHKVLKNLEQYRAQRAENKEQINFINLKRKADNADFDRSTAQHAELISAIKESIKELKHLAGSISGVGKPEHVKEIPQEKRDKLFKSFLQVTQNDEQLALQFITLATEADQKELGELIALLIKLKSSAQASFNDDVNAEETSKKKHSQIVDLLEGDLEKLKVLIKQSKINLKTYQQRIISIDKEIKLKKSMIKSKKHQINAIEVERIAKEKQYLADKSEREREMTVLGKLEGIVERRLASMTPKLKANVDPSPEK